MRSAMNTLDHISNSELREFCHSLQSRHTKTVGYDQFYQYMTNRLKDNPWFVETVKTMVSSVPLGTQKQLQFMLGLLGYPEPPLSIFVAIV
jgi:hypothetical protein